LSDLADDVAAVARGDTAAFGRIVSATSNKLVRLAARIMGNLEDGEDVAQEAYVKAHRAIVEGRFDGRSKVETWLHRIVTNAAIDALRSGIRRQQPTDVLPDAGWDGAAAAEARVALRELDALLGTLPPDQRAALVLKSVEGRSSSEVAELMGSTEGAVEQLLFRARATLKERRRPS
jgi:RNA polymerase sigma-70 factor, ECF subfamily